VVADLLVDRNVDYAAAKWQESDLPYRFSVEAFHAGALRRANESANTAFDRENTTPCLRESTLEPPRNWPSVLQA